MGAPLGSNTKESVRKQIRDCDIHGPEQHEEMLVGENANPRWQCSACRRDKNKKFNAETKAGVERRSYIKKREPKHTACTGCGEWMPLSGVCDNC
jgi:hypothetical protein